MQDTENVPRAGGDSGATGELFKVGLLVPDLQGAMADLGRWLDLRWTPVQESPLKLETGAGIESVRLRFAYSMHGPVYLELIEAQPSGYYALAGRPGLHHVGRWVEDLPAASMRLSEAGLPREAAGRNDAGECPSIFAFHAEADGDGLRVELVDRAMQPSFDAWLAGDRLDLG